MTSVEKPLVGCELWQQARQVLDERGVLYSDYSNLPSNGTIVAEFGGLCIEDSGKSVSVIVNDTDPSEGDGTIMHVLFDKNGHVTDAAFKVYDPNGESFTRQIGNKQLAGFLTQVCRAVEIEFTSTDNH